MMGPGLAHQPQVSSFLSTFPGPVFCMEYPGPGAASGLGYVSSARNTARLSMISSQIFPLPAPLRIAQQPPPPPGPPPPLSHDDRSLNSNTPAVASFSSEDVHCISSLTKVVWDKGRPVIKPKDMRYNQVKNPNMNGSTGEVPNNEPTRPVMEGSMSVPEATRATTAAMVDVAQLHADLHLADPELRSKLERLAPFLPRTVETVLPGNNTALGTTGIADRTNGTAALSGIKRDRSDANDLTPGNGVSMTPNITTRDGSSNTNNKRAAAEVQARLRGTLPKSYHNQPPPLPKAPPPPPPPSMVPLLPGPTAPPAHTISYHNSCPPSTLSPQLHNVVSHPPNYPHTFYHPEVTFLGTGSAEPSQYRGASAIHLSLAGPHSPGLLLDCGEGCWGQLVRLHGPQKALLVIKFLSAIWISHRHADHMAGVLQVLANYPQSAPPLLLVGPHSLKAWLAEAAPSVNLATRYVFAHCSDILSPQHWSRISLRNSFGFSYITSVPVRHCADAYGVVLRHQSGWSLVYSGDTQPSEALIRAGAGATLLIHEATFEPALESEARRKRHSTSVEAIDVAQRMGAYRTILTHFSQRYPKFPEGIDVDSSLEEMQLGRGVGSSVAVAFDGMCVPLPLLDQLPAVTVAVKAVLEAAEMEKEQRAATINE